VVFIKLSKVICVQMNAIEAGICFFGQYVKQIVENDFEVDFEAKIRLAVLFLPWNLQLYNFNNKF